jgi:hypothetical protein
LTVRAAWGRAAALSAVLGCGAGCHALFGRSPWGDEPIEVSQESAEEPCASCHVEVAERHLHGPHGRTGIACGQCHRGAGHPDFEEPLADGTCGGCHLAEYQQVSRSAHARDATELPAAVTSSTLREDAFRIRSADGTVFATRDRRSPQAGLLCAGCHFDGHRVSASRSRSVGFCEACHAYRDDHYAQVAADGNRCLACHMQRGATVTGQRVTSHAFASHEARER